MKCCGEIRSTAYCPDCGKRVADSALASLLRHCRAHGKQAAARLAKRAQWAEEHPDQDNDKRRARTAALAATVAKWQSWVTLLELAAEHLE